jgi:peptidoglycan/LPS O-acetylase OafA/YrhL
MTGLNDIVAPTLDHNAPLWSLSFEIWFYIVGGALGYIVVKKADTAHPSSLAVLAICVPIFAMHSTEYLMYWGLGAFMIEYRKTPIRAPLFFAGVVLFLAGAILHELTFASRSFENVAFVPIQFSRSMLCVGTCLMFPLLCDHRIDSLLQIIRKPAAALSAFSYTLYLFHYPVNSVLDLIFPKFGAISLEAIGIFSARVLICISFSIGFYFCFERNTAFLRQYIRQRLYKRNRGAFFRA